MVAAQVVNAIQTIVARNIDPLKSAVVTLGELHAGSAVNVIADQARLSGTVRYFDETYEGYFAKRLHQIIGGVCQSHGATYDLDYNPLYPPVINNADIAELVRSVALSVIETPAGVVPECQTMGGEDMSFFPAGSAGVLFLPGGGERSEGTGVPSPSSPL